VDAVPHAHLNASVLHTVARRVGQPTHNPERQREIVNEREIKKKEG
jgi:hypothetical protein